LAAVLPIALLFLGLYSFSWGAKEVQQAIWAPAEAGRDVLMSLCSAPKGSSFVCPYSQGQHNRLFFSVFYFVYFVAGVFLAWAFFALRRKRAAVHF
jgi:hypothetical protein